MQTIQLVASVKGIPEISVSTFPTEHQQVVFHVDWRQHTFLASLVVPPPFGVRALVLKNPVGNATWPTWSFCGAAVVVVFWVRSPYP